MGRNNAPVLLPLLLCAAARPQLAQPRGPRRHGWRARFLDEARRRRLPHRRRLAALSKIHNLHDDPYLPGRNAYGDRNIQHKYTDDLPEVHDVLKEVRQVVDKYPGNPVLVTEADEPNVEALTKCMATATKCSCRWTSRLPT